MDRFSFLNAAHTQFFGDLYEQYTINPDAVEPSWRAFFQGFDFGMESSGTEQEIAQLANFSAEAQDCSFVSDKLLKEFNVLKLIDAYRTRGHLFTKTNPVRDRRTYAPTLALENFGLSASDLETVFDAARVIGHEPSSLKEIIRHLDAVYCQPIEIEYIYIRKPEVIE